MRKILQNKAVALTSSLLKLIKLNVILPFPEKPSTHFGPVQEVADDSKRDLDASDLFCLFTADIIKKEVTFTR